MDGQERGQDDDEAEEVPRGAEEVPGAVGVGAGDVGAPELLVRYAAHEAAFS